MPILNTLYLKYNGVCLDLNISEPLLFKRIKACDIYMQECGQLPRLNNFLVNDNGMNMKIENTDTILLLCGTNYVIARKSKLPFVTLRRIYDTMVVLTN